MKFTAHGCSVALLTLWMAGCTSVERPPPREDKIATPTTAPAEPPPAVPAPAVPPRAPETPPPAKPEPKPAKPPVSSEPIKSKSTPATVVPKAVPALSPPPLDLAGLEKRLKDTKAIGVFTKLTLKNQVDDLLDQFREYYQGRLSITLTDLREPFNSLMLKVLALLQDGDPQLARDLVASREAIWGILSDPKKFATL